MNSEEIAELIAELIAEGHSARDAAKIATSVAKNSSSGGSHLAKSSVDENSLTRSPILDRRNSVDYGNETPEQARQRWFEQERNDPQGIYSGGSTSGGVFGSGAIATADYDPDAVNRTMGAFERVQTLQVQSETLHVLQQLAQQRNAEPLKRIAAPPNAFTRLLGRKKPR